MDHESFVLSAFRKLDTTTTKRKIQKHVFPHCVTQSLYHGIILIKSKEHELPGFTFETLVIIKRNISHKDMGRERKLRQSLVSLRPMTC